MYDIVCEHPDCEVVLGTGSKPIDGMVCVDHVPAYVPEITLEERIAQLEGGMSAMMMQTPVE